MFKKLTETATSGNISTLILLDKFIVAVWPGSGVLKLVKSEKTLTSIVLNAYWKKNIYILLLQH